MKLLSFLLMAILKGIIFTLDCSSIFTESECIKETQCSYKKVNSSCNSKCSSYQTLNECQIDMNCQAIPQSCQPTYQKCSEAPPNDQWACIYQNVSCLYYPSFSGTCTVKQVVIDTCSSFIDKNTCMNGSFNSCVWTPDDSVCSQKKGVCSLSNQQETCNAPFCMFKPKLCTSLDDCRVGTSQQICSSFRGCLWDGFYCNVNPTCQDGSQCDLSICKVLSLASCLDSAYSGQYVCNQILNTEDCKQNPNCSPTSIGKGTCSVRTDLCDFLTCDLSLCVLTQPIQSQCRNASCPNDIVNCSQTNFCQVTPFQCVSKAGKECTQSDSKAECESSIKHCYYSSNGTCEAATKKQKVFQNLMDQILHLEFEDFKSEFLYQMFTYVV